MLVHPDKRRKAGGGLRIGRRNTAGMGGLEALLVGAPAGLPPGELWRQGMRGMGESLVGGWANALTGGAVANVGQQLARVEIALKVSTVAAIVSAAIGVLLAFRSHSRRA